jgi:pimeloyl-ACP methyl ester carboxylesterase
MELAVDRGEFPQTTSLLVVQDGKTVYEHYWQANVDTQHDTRSATKSITALAIGIAVGRGKIAAPPSRNATLRILHRARRCACAQRLPCCMHDGSDAPCGCCRESAHAEKAIDMPVPGNPTAISIVLVHGAFVDGSGWFDVFKILKKAGHEVSMVQHPTRSLADDVAVTRRAIAAQAGPVLLVGHSYGGVVISEAGTDPKVAGLVYIAAFAPDKGESVSLLIKDPPPGAPVPPILPPQEGSLFLDRAKFRASFAADVDADTADFMASAQLPWGVEALDGAVSQPAWRSRPSWYLVASEDHMIPPPAQRAMARRAGAEVTEVTGSHAVYVSQPRAVAALIEKAAGALAASK